MAKVTSGAQLEDLNGYLGPCSTFGPLLGVLLVLYKGNTDLWGLLAYCWGTTSTKGLQGQGNTQYRGTKNCGLLRLHWGTTALGDYWGNTEYRGLLSTGGHWCTSWGLYTSYLVLSGGGGTSPKSPF